MSHHVLRVGVLGTTYTMEGPIYPRELARHGIEAVLRSPADRAFVNDTIFGELVHGRLADETRTRYVRLIEAFAAQACDAVALVGTEIPLLVPPEASPLPTLDSTRLLAQTVLEVACGRAAMPAWHGGPVDA